MAIVERRRFARRLCGAAALFAVALSGSVSAGAAAPSSSGDTTSAAATIDASLRPGASEALESAWRAILSHSVVLGPSHVAHAGVLAQLRTASRPTALEQWGSAHGLIVTWVPGDDWAAVAGSAPRLGRALHVTIDEFRGPDGRTFYAATSRARPPTPDVAAFGSIDSYGHFVPLDVPNGGITPSGLRQAYDATPLTSQGMDGKGETIVFFETDGFSQSDLNRYAAQYHLPPFDVTVVGGQAGEPVGESNMDLEVAHGIAPAARLVYVNFLTNVAEVMATTFATVTKGFPGALWSMSLGSCEKFWGFDAPDLNLLEAALVTAEQGGTTVFVSSGDAGGLDCTPPELEPAGGGMDVASQYGDSPQNSFVGVNLPADFPAVVSVGGTRLSVTKSGTYAGEQAWTEPVLSQGSGGGVSEIWDPPAYQKGPGTGNFASVFGAAPPGRQVPDVAAVADPATGAAIYSGGSQRYGGGTSLAAPVWAGFMALIDQYLSQQRLPAVGLANPALYELASQVQPYRPFHDITEGGNAVNSATEGYDMVTGLGSPDVWNLARDLARMGK